MPGGLYSRRPRARRPDSEGEPVEVKIGIQSVPRELVVETDTPAEEIERQLASALAGDDHSVFAVTMSKGGKILVPADKIAYVEFGVPETRRVGFGNIV
jgi:hypothetical protein